MEKVRRLKGKAKGTKHGAKHRISQMIEKYGDVVTLVRDIDRKPGSPSQYKVDYNRMVFWLALAGLTEYEMANVLGVTDDVFAIWKKTRPDFNKAVQSGRTESVGVTAHSLFRLANGYEHESVKLIPNRVKEYDKDTGKIVKEYTTVIHEPYIKKYPPHFSAIAKFLSAKHPEVWGDRSELVHTGQVQHSIDATKLTKKQLKLLQKIAQSGVKATKSDKNSEKKMDKNGDD